VSKSSLPMVPAMCNLTKSCASTSSSTTTTKIPCFANPSTNNKLCRLLKSYNIWQLWKICCSSSAFKIQRDFRIFQLYFKNYVQVSLLSFVLKYHEIM
jgi:hypothetical protein